VDLNRFRDSPAGQLVRAVRGSEANRKVPGPWGVSAWHLSTGKHIGMKIHRLLIPGLLLLLVGCTSTLYLAVNILGARVHAIFGSIVTEAPSKAFPRMRCPLLLATGERATVGVTIANRSDRSLSYSVDIQVKGLQLDAPTAFQGVTLSPGRRASLTWPIVAPDAAPKYSSSSVIIQAVSSADRALPGPFHMWPTSYRQSCGIWIVDSPLKGHPIIGLSLGGLAAGALLCLLYLIKRKPGPA
jgi:hypothetical protein